MIIGIVGAMEAEVNGLLQMLEHKSHSIKASLTFYQGMLAGKSVIVVRCGIGKVNAAICTQILIDHFHVTAIINTGVAGGISGSVEIGDIVISSAALYHDFDTTIFGYPLGQIPQMEKSCFAADLILGECALTASRTIVGAKRTHFGVVVSGDQFISSLERKAQIATVFQATCAEMEGAAIAHTACLNTLPYVIIRTISDKADNSAPDNFDAFTEKIIPSLNQIVHATVDAYSVCSS